MRLFSISAAAVIRSVLTTRPVLSRTANFGSLDHSHPSPYLKRHLNWLSRFCRAHARLTDNKKYRPRLIGNNRPKLHFMRCNTTTAEIRTCRPYYVLQIVFGLIDVIFADFFTFSPFTATIGHKYVC